MQRALAWCMRIPVRQVPGEGSLVQPAATKPPAATARKRQLSPGRGTGTSRDEISFGGRREGGGAGAPHP